MNPDGTSVVTPVQRTSMSGQLQQTGSSFSAAPDVRHSLQLIIADEFSILRQGWWSCVIVRCVILSFDLSE